MDFPNEQLPYLLALIRIPGLGPVKVSEILKQDLDLESLFKDGQNERTKNILKGFNITPDWAAVEKDLRWAENPGCYILTQSHPEYPSLLKEIHNAPSV